MCLTKIITKVCGVSSEALEERLLTGSHKYVAF